MGSLKMRLSAFLRSDAANPTKHAVVTGYGSRMENNKLKTLSGLTWPSLKKNYSLIPLFVIMGAGTVMMVSYIIRLATKTTDVSWRKPKEGEAPYDYYRGKQFKFLNPSGIDFSKFGTDIPDYRNVPKSD